MNTYEKCQAIRRVITNRAAEVMAYANWTSEYAASQIRNLPHDLLRRHPELGQIQPAELTTEQCDDLGFGLWEEGNAMRLIPLWLLPFLADDVKTTCINGEIVVRKSDMDNDQRYGCIAYGIIPSA